jgi:hypothetical protein
MYPNSNSVEINTVKENSPKNLGYFCKSQKLPNLNYHPIGENSPNLVTLYCMYIRHSATQKSCYM